MHAFDLKCCDQMLDVFLGFLLCPPPPSVPVADIKALLIGKDCPHMKDNKGKQTKVRLSLLSPDVLLLAKFKSL